MLPEEQQTLTVSSVDNLTKLTFIDYDDGNDDEYKNGAQNV